MNFLNLVFLAFYFGIVDSNPLVTLKKENGGTVLHLFMKKENSIQINSNVSSRTCVEEGDLEIRCSFASGNEPHNYGTTTTVYIEQDGISSQAQTYRQVPVGFRSDRYLENVGTTTFHCLANITYSPQYRYTDKPSKAYSPLAIVRSYDCGSIDTVEVHMHKAAIGSQIEINCGDHSLSPNITGDWILEGLWSGKQILNETTEKLTLLNITHEHVGKYKCQVWFEDLRFRYSNHFDLRLLAPPLPPIRLHLIAPSERSAIFEWKPDPFDRLELAPEALQYSYKIKYNKIGRWVVDGPIQMQTNDTSAALLNLSPDTWYRLEVTAMNMYGESDPVRYDFFTRNPTEAHANIIADTRITVAANQDVMVSCRRYGNVSGVKWQQYEGRRWSDLAKSGQQLLHSSSQFGRIYKCQAPFTNGSTHEFTIRVSVIARPKPLKNLKCTAQDGGLVLTWHVPGNDTEAGSTQYRPTTPPQGSIPAQNQAQYYLIQFSKLSRQNAWKEKKVGTDEKQTVLMGLESGLYAIRISAVNEAGGSVARSTTCRL